MPPRRPRVLFAALYPASQAGTRLRAAAWEADLRSSGIDTEVWSFLSAKDSQRWFAAPSAALRTVLLLRAAVRAGLLYMRLPRYDTVVVLREVVPAATAAFERRAARRSILVWDVDDAIWAPYPRMFLRWLPERMRRSSRKYETVANLAKEVWAGSEELAAWCRAHADDVWILPTVPDPPEETPGLAERGGAVWVGSVSTAPFLESILPLLVGAPDEQPIEVRVVGAKVDGPPGVRVHCTPWSERAEADALGRGRVGLYPLDLDHPLAPDRAGFKALLYMAHGLPSLVTPAPSVARLVRDGVDGVHVPPGGAWGPPLRRLLADDEAWARMSRAAQERAAHDYTTHVWAPRVAARLDRLLAGVSGRPT